MKNKSAPYRWHPSLLSTIAKLLISRDASQVREAEKLLNSSTKFEAASGAVKTVAVLLLLCELLASELRDQRLARKKRRAADQALKDVRTTVEFKRRQLSDEGQSSEMSSSPGHAATPVVAEAPRPVDHNAYALRNLTQAANHLAASGRTAAADRVRLLRIELGA